MQFHDQFWKNELTRFRGEVRSINITINSEEEIFFKAERPILYSAFIVRKLIEDTAVTDRLKSGSIKLLSSPSSRSSKVPFLEIMTGPLEVDSEFDLKTQNPVRINYFDLASEIIHSDGFIWNFNNKDKEFLVFSYRNLLNRLLWVPLLVYCEMLDHVLSDSPKRWYSMKDNDTGKVTRHAE